MIGTATFYAIDPAKEADDMFAPRISGVTVEQAAGMCRDALVMWTTTDERFGVGHRAPTPYCRFFYSGREIINPYALFLPLPERISTAKVASLFERFEHG